MCGVGPQHFGQKATFVYATVRAAWSKYSRDREKLSARLIVQKAARYACELLLAKVYLQEVDQVGAGVRTFLRPRIENFGQMRIGNNTILRSVNVPVELCTAEGAELHIGEQCSLNYGVSIGATGSIIIGDRVRLGPYVMVVDTDFHHPLRRGERPAPRPVVIEDDVWVGAKASIMPGVRLGRGAIVGTAAVVTKDVAAFTVVAGVPAREVRRLDASQFEPEKSLT